MIRATPDIHIDDREVREEFVRSSGPGGQNVNKVSTAVQLRFDVLHSPSLPDDVRRRLVARVHNQMTEEGILVIDARRFRSQRLNREDARERLAQLVRSAAVKPKIRRKTRPGAAAREKRLSEKKRRSEVKMLRRG